MPAGGVALARGGTVRGGMATGGTMTVRSGTARQQRQEGAWRDGGMARWRHGGQGQHGDKWHNEGRHNDSEGWHGGIMTARGGTMVGGTTKGGATTARGGKWRRRWQGAAWQAA